MKLDSWNSWRAAIISIEERALDSILENKLYCRHMTILYSLCANLSQFKRSLEVKLFEIGTCRPPEVELVKGHVVAKILQVMQ